MFLELAFYFEVSGEPGFEALKRGDVVVDRYLKVLKLRNDPGRLARRRGFPVLLLNVLRLSV